MLTPSVVERDLDRHLRRIDAETAREDRLQDLQEERRRFLLEDRPGLSLVIEALYVEEPGYPLDEALFALRTAWKRQEPLERLVGALIRLLDGKAERMAQAWAEWCLPRIEDAEADDDDFPF